MLSLRETTKSVIDEVNSAEESWALYRQLIQEVKSISNNRDTWTISFTPRECNKAAHLMAKFAMSINREQWTMWIEENPSCISTCILNEKLWMKTCQVEWINSFILSKKKN